MNLYCVRHGEAESADVDPERPLTENGRQEVERVANYLHGHDLKVAHVMHSTKLRAKQTAEIFAEAMMPGQVTECESILDEDANVMELMQMIPAWTDDTMIVGHLPFMPRLISGLLIGNPHIYPIVNYPPAGVVCLQHFDQHRWIIQWILNPFLVSEQRSDA